MIKERLINILNESFPSSEINVEDPIGDAKMFKISIKSDLFEGKSMLEQHRMVYSFLGDITNEIHSIVLDTSVREEDAKS